MPRLPDNQPTPEVPPGDNRLLPAVPDHRLPDWVPPTTPIDSLNNRSPRQLDILAKDTAVPRHYGQCQIPMRLINASRSATGTTVTMTRPPSFQGSFANLRSYYIDGLATTYSASGPPWIVSMFYADSDVQGIAEIIYEPRVGEVAAVDALAEVMKSAGLSVKEDGGLPAVQADNETMIAGRMKRGVGVYYDEARSIESIITELSEYARCKVYRNQDGDYDFVLVGTMPSPAINITTADMVADSFAIRTPNPANVPSVVEVEYSDATEIIWQRRVATSLSGTYPATATVSRISLPFITHFSHAARVAITRQRENGRRQIRWQGWDDSWRLLPGEVVTVTFPPVFTGLVLIQEVTWNGVTVDVQGREWVATDEDLSSPTTPDWTNVVGAKVGEVEPSVNWRGLWAANVGYLANDLVVNDGTGYIAVTKHTSAAATEPGTTGGETIWQSTAPVAKTVSNFSHNPVTGVVTISYTDGTTDTFTVLNGVDGSSITVTNVAPNANGDIVVTFSDDQQAIIPSGVNGVDGVGIETIVRVGSVVTVTYDDGAQTLFALEDGHGFENIFTPVADDMETVPSDEWPSNVWGFKAPGTVNTGLSNERTYYGGVPPLAALEGDTPRIAEFNRDTIGLPSIGSVVADSWIFIGISGRYGGPSYSITPTDGAITYRQSGTVHSLTISLFRDRLMVFEYDINVQIENGVISLSYPSGRPSGLVFFVTSDPGDYLRLFVTYGVEVGVTLAQTYIELYYSYQETAQTTLADHEARLLALEGTPPPPAGPITITGDSSITIVDGTTAERIITWRQDGTLIGQATITIRTANSGAVIGATVDRVTADITSQGSSIARVVLTLDADTSSTHTFTATWQAAPQPDPVTYGVNGSTSFDVVEGTSVSRTVTFTQSGSTVGAATVTFAAQSSPDSISIITGATSGPVTVSSTGTVTYTSTGLSVSFSPTWQADPAGDTITASGGGTFNFLQHNQSSGWVISFTNQHGTLIDQILGSASGTTSGVSVSVNQQTSGVTRVGPTGSSSSFDRTLTATHTASGVTRSQRWIWAPLTVTAPVSAISVSAGQTVTTSSFNLYQGGSIIGSTRVRVVGGSNGTWTASLVNSTISGFSLVVPLNPTSFFSAARVRYITGSVSISSLNFSISLV